MDKQTEKINIYNDIYDGNPIIVIRQPSSMEDDQLIFVHPDQVDLLIQWIKEAKNDIVSKG